MPNYDFLFVDESGDPGYQLDPISGDLVSSPYYTTAVLHVCDNSIPLLTRHIANFRFYRGWYNNLKIPVGAPEFSGFVGPVRAMAEEGGNIWASVVYLDKARYTGSYLKPGGKRPSNPIRFRNYVLRRLLEFHFQHYPLLSKQYDLILDRFEMTAGARENLLQYLAGNWFLPTPKHITHAASAYVDGLQFVHHIANGFAGAAVGGSAPNELSFVAARDLTNH